MRLTSFIPCTLILLAACSATHHRATKMDSLAGTWIGVSATVGGRALPETTVNQLRPTLTADRYKTEKGNEVLFDSTYSLDSSRSPKEINMIGTEGDFAGKTAEGIYALEGDTLQVCYTMPGKPRPNAFSSPAGTGIYLIVWKRQSP